MRSSSANARENATMASSVSPFRKYRTPRLLYAPASDGSIRRANDRRMSISPPFAAAGGRAVAAGVMWSVYAHRAEDCVEGALIGDKQEKAVQTLDRLLQEERGLDAKDRRVGARRVITKRAKRMGRVTRRQRWRRKHEGHAEELAQCSKVRARENVARFLERGLLELSKAHRCSALASQHPLGETDPRLSSKEKNGLPAYVARHRHLNGDNLDIGRDLGHEVARRNDVDHRHADHDAGARERRQGGGSVAGSYVRDLAQRVQPGAAHQRRSTIGRLCVAANCHFRGEWRRRL